MKTVTLVSHLSQNITLVGYFGIEGVNESRFCIVSPLLVRFAKLVHASGLQRDGTANEGQRSAVLVHVVALVVGEGHRENQLLVVAGADLSVNSVQMSA